MRRTVDRFRPRQGRDLPVIAIEAASGPTLVVTANVHGDEVTGVAAAHALDALLQAELRRGRVILFPSLNPAGLEARKRMVPEDGADLNRLFPGDLRGVGSELLAADIFREVLRHRPHALIDLHADSATAIPYAIVDRAVRLDVSHRRRLSAALQALGQASGLTVLREYPEDEYLRFGLDRSLAGAMVNHAGVPAITIEAGPRRAVDPEAVDAAVTAVRRILHHLGLIDAAPEPHPTRRDGAIYRRASAPRTRRAGVLIPRRRPGDVFRIGEVIARVHGLDGQIVEELRAPADGIVVSWNEGGWIEARGVTGTLGIVEG